jgi:hypothetical protein
MPIDPQDSGVFHSMGDAMMRTLSRWAKPVLALPRPAVSSPIKWANRN